MIKGKLLAVAFGGGTNSTAMLCGALLLAGPRFRHPLTDDLDPKVMLPSRRASPPLFPLVGSRTWAANRGNDLGGGEFSKSFVEGHGRILPPEKKCAMQKRELAEGVQCIQDADMTAYPTPEQIDRIVTEARKKVVPQHFGKRFRVLVDGKGVEVQTVPALIKLLSVCYADFDSVKVFRNGNGQAAINLDT